MTIIVALGSIRGTSSTGLATSLAALVGILARRPTLLIDFSPEPERLRQTLGVTDPAGIEPLLDLYIRNRPFGSADVRGQVVRYTAPDELGLAGQGFDLLLGPFASSDHYRDRLATQRGAAFARLLIGACEELEWKTVITNLGSDTNTLRGELWFERADLVILCHTEQITLNQWAVRRRRMPALKAGAEFRVVSEAMFPFPDPRFVESLTSRDRTFENASSRLALDCAEDLYPSISEQLVDGQGNRIRPRKSVWRELLGLGG